MMFALLLHTSIVLGSGTIDVHSTHFDARIEGGAITNLQTDDGTQYVHAPEQLRGAGLHHIDGDHWVDLSASQGVRSDLPTLAAGQSFGRDFSLQGLNDTQLQTRYRVDSSTGELIIDAEAHSAQEGIWGISWWIADIPLQYAILVPGTSGVRLTRHTPQASHHYDYPLAWEAQFVVVEGPSGGFYVWAEDTEFRYKRLVVERRPSGWRLGFYTLNNAPFDKLKACRSVSWRLATYQGDWRVAAKRYRDWFCQTARPVPIDQQHPDWVRDIRASSSCQPTFVRWKNCRTSSIRSRRYCTSTIGDSRDTIATIQIMTASGRGWRHLSCAHMS